MCPCSTFRGNVRDSGRHGGCLPVLQNLKLRTTAASVQGAACTGRVKHGLPPSQRSAPCGTTTSLRQGLEKQSKAKGSCHCGVSPARRSCAEESRFRLRAPPKTAPKFRICIDAACQDDEAAYILRRLDGEMALEWPNPVPPEAPFKR